MDNEELQEEQTNASAGSTTPSSVGLYSVAVSSQITETLITTLVEKCETNIEPLQIVQYSITGQLYMQIIGEPRKSYSVICYGTESQRTSLETAWYGGMIIKVVFDGGTSVCYGRIVEYSKERLGETQLFDGTGWNTYYKMELKLGHMSTPQPTPPEPTEPTDPSEETEPQETT